MDKAILDYVGAAVGFTPSEIQREILLSSRRNTMVAGGVRSGKSYVAAFFNVCKMVQSFVDGTARPGDVYWLVAADYERTRAEFGYITSFLAKLGWLGDVTRPINPGQITLGICPCESGGCDPDDPAHKRIAVKTKTAADYKSLAMEAPCGIVVCEGSQIDLESFWRVEERLIEKRGWLFIEGSFETSLGWYPERFERWASPVVQEEEDAIAMSMPTWSNLAVFPGGREDPEIVRMENSHSEDWFNERIAGVPAPPSGRVFPEFRTEVHVRDGLEFIEGIPVYVWVDPGFSRATESAYAVICAQYFEGQLRVFDEVYEQELVGAQVVDIAMQRDWWAKADKIGAIDIAGTQRTGVSDTAASHADVWLERAGLYMKPQRVPITDGIERVRTFLKQDPRTLEPKMVVSSVCRGFISEAGGGVNPFTGRAQVYQWQTDKEGNVVGNVPRDRYNHSSKALAYGISAEFGAETGPRERKTVKVKRHVGVN